MLSLFENEFRRIDRLLEAGQLSDIPDLLRNIPLEVFGKMLLEIPTQYPNIKSNFPSMPSEKIQNHWTGNSGDILLGQSLAFVRIMVAGYAAITGKKIKNARILDFGCGWGRIIRLLYKYLPTSNIYGVDPWDESIKECEKHGIKVNLALSDWVPQSLPFDCQFDLIFAFSVFTHLSEKTAQIVLQTLRKYIKPDGVLIITIRPKEYWQIHEKGLHFTNMIDTHEEKGFAFIPQNLVPIDGDITYGDASISLEYFTSHFKDWEVESVEYNEIDPYQIVLFLKPVVFEDALDKISLQSENKTEIPSQRIIFNNEKKLFVPSNHYYSPFPDPVEVEKYYKNTFIDAPKSIPDIDLNSKQQTEILDEFSDFYTEMPFRESKTNDLRFYFNNPNFGYGDAIVLYSMIRKLKPKKYIEIGSGFSSCVALDTNEIFIGNEVDFTFIEPYPELLQSLIRPIDNIKILNQKLQEVNIKVFQELNEGDILFIDSTHVCKIGSDVRVIFFELLPLLNKGVYIHFHDIFYPFEYPEHWIKEGRAWNENYIIRAFLQNNHDYKIMFFNNYMGKVFPDLMEEKIPLFIKNIGGSIWLNKL
jgi:ubiquinone/menaquinone biosynthesis C-methylase UbiE